jgi:2-oxoglutarate dehydrogenase E2 component (dihydrolipoamide succinyltransferase)
VEMISNTDAQSDSDNLHRVDMDPIARIIAQRMVESKKISAHVTTMVEVDVTKLVLWRNGVKEHFQQREGIGLNFLPAIVQSTAKALKLFPKVNASVEGTQYILKKQINIGIAVALPDDNLIVPVVREADKLSLSGIAHSIDSLAIKARSNKLKMEEIEGGTFTITNFGTFKNTFGTPIINQPEVAILGVGYIEKKPAVLETPQGDVIAIRHKMYLSLTYDHRIINGAMGGAFLRQIADYIEHWEES